LESALDEIAADLRDANIQRLLANEQFLEDRLGQAEPDDTDIP
jgi:hypothetical protein